MIQKPTKIHWLHYDNHIPLLNTLKILRNCAELVENYKNFIILSGLPDFSHKGDHVQLFLFLSVNYEWKSQKVLCMWTAWYSQHLEV